MKVYYLTKKQITNCILIMLILLITSYFFSICLTNNLAAIPTGKTTPIYYQGAGDKKQISFAINVDWGEEFIPEMLQVLEKNKVHATFFLTGRWTEKFPDLALTIAQKGHEIGNHGFSHNSPNKMSLEQNKEEINRAAQIIKSATTKQTVLYAPPSGEKKPHVLMAAHELGYKTILWSIDTIDWKRPASHNIITRVLPRAHNGAIILMHPTHPTLEALPTLISKLKSQGYFLVTVSENIK
ncbi:MAG: polysaccharide deacetylase family protein [Bacillota bacterium]